MNKLVEKMIDTNKQIDSVDKSGDLDPHLRDSVKFEIKPIEELRKMMTPEQIARSEADFKKYWTDKYGDLSDVDCSSEAPDNYLEPVDLTAFPEENEILVNKMDSVESSNIDKIALGDDKLYVVFKNGGMYSYKGVTTNDYEEFKKAESVGRHFRSHIQKANYECEKLEDKELRVYNGK